MQGGLMSFRSPLLGVLMSAVGLVSIGLSASTGVNKAVADPSGDRLGCNTFCQNAGGYGGAGGTVPRPAVTVVSSGAVTADPDGYVPVPLTCHLSVQCAGALLVSGPAGGGRSDLLVNAGATRTIAVPLGSSAIAFLQSNGPTTMHVTTDARESPGMVNGSESGFDAIGLDGQLTVAAPG
jgi:hypothetical protein